MEMEPTPTSTSHLANFPAEEYPLLVDKTNTATDFIDVYVRYADVYESPALVHQAVALSVIATMLNRNGVEIQHGPIKIPFDLWMLLLSGSGFGRNTAVNAIRPILDDAEIADLIVAPMWGSPAAFYQGIAEHPIVLQVHTEFAYLLKRLYDTPTVMEWITDAYDSNTIPPPFNYRRTGKKQDTPPIEFSQAPRLSFLSTSSHDWFMCNLKEEHTTGGFVPRWFMLDLSGFETRLVPKPQAPDIRLLPTLVNHLKRINGVKGEADLSKVEYEYEAWYKETHARFSESEFRSMAEPFFNRLRTHVLKLAVLYQVSTSVRLQIEHDALARAFELALQAERTIFSLMKTGFTHEGAQVRKMLEVVRSAGSGGMLKSEFTSRFASTPVRERDGRLQTLLASGKVLLFDRPTSGRRAMVLVASEFEQAHHELFPEDSE